MYGAALPVLEERSEAELLVHDLGAELVPPDVDEYTDDSDHNSQHRTEAPDADRSSEEEHRTTTGNAL